jgi:hypothetical protein
MCSWIGALEFVVPGVMILVFGCFLGHSSLQELAEFLRSVENLLYIVIVFPIAYLYNIMNFRGPFLRGSHSLIQANIKEKLIAPFETEEVIKVNKESLTQGQQLVNLFYRIVDNDESLKSKTQDVYFNGLLWSSTADLMAVSLLFIPVYIIAYVIRPLPHYLPIALGLCIVFLFASRVAMPRVTSRHIELSNDQLEFILQHHREDVHKGLLRLASDAAVRVTTPDDGPKAQ